MLKKIFENWQVLLTVIAGATSLWVNYANEERRHFELNKTAIEVAEQRTAAFFDRPGYVLTFLENAYPEHAYCAALSTMQACVSAMGAQGNDSSFCFSGPAALDFDATSDQSTSTGPGETALKSARDTLGREIDVFAQRAGLSVAALSDNAHATAAQWGTEGNQAEASCNADMTDLVKTMSWAEYLGYLRMPEDCRETLGLFKKTTCNSDVGRRQEAFLSELNMSLVDPLVDAIVVNNPETTQPIVVELPECTERPVIYSHIGRAADQPAAEDLRDVLGVLGWQTVGIETVDGYRSAGDIRYYYPEQADCAEVLRLEIQAMGVWPNLKTIYLGDKYSNLPRGRVELWLGEAMN